MLYCLPYMVLYHRFSFLCALIFILVYVYVRTFFFHTSWCFIYMQCLRKTKGCHMLWKWSHWCLWAAVRVLGTQPRPSARAARALHHWVSTSAQAWSLVHTPQFLHVITVILFKNLHTCWCFNVVFCPPSLMFPLLSWVYWRLIIFCFQHFYFLSQCQFFGYFFFTLLNDSFPHVAFLSWFWI